jgi:ABC-type transport system involved in multi-copper enzyme maturation permease subunit
MKHHGKPQPPPVRSTAARSGPPPRRRSPFLSAIAGDFRHFSPRRTWTVARLAVSETLRLHVLAVFALGLLAVVLADVTSKRFDPVFDTASSLIRISELVLLMIGLLFAVFLSTYSLPRELASKTIYSLVTKPVSRLEIVLGKAVGIVLVVGVVTFGLGLACLGYMHFRGGQVASLAASRLQQMAAETDATVVPTDVPPVALQSIAERGPFNASTRDLPSGGITMISGLADPALLGQGYTWLSGFPTHRAHWVFEDLPGRDLDAGNAVVHLKVAVGEAGGPFVEERRKVLVRIFLQGGQSRELPSVLTYLAPDGTLSVPIPALKEGEQPYAGQRLWVSLAGVRTPPLALKQDSCVITLAEGRTIRSTRDVMLTGEYSMGRNRFGGRSPEMNSLQAKAVFADVPPGDIGHDGATLRIRVGLSSLGRNLPQARTKIVTVVGEGTLAEQRREFTFRPVDRGEQLIPLPRDYYSGGRLIVYLSSEVEVSLADTGVQLVTSSRAFAINWLVDLTLIWLSFSILSCVGVMVSTVAGWHVASIATAMVYLFASVWALAVSNVRHFGFSFGSGQPAKDGFARAMAEVHSTVFIVLGHILPNFDRLDQSEAMVQGQYLSPGTVLLAFPSGAAWYALLYIVAVLVLAYLFFLRREVAS